MPNDKRAAEMLEGIKKNVIEFGQSVVSIYPDIKEQKLITPGYAYTVGRSKTEKEPEMIIFGVPVELGHGMLTAIFDLKKQGQEFPINTPLDGIIRDLPVCLLPIKKENAIKYMFMTEDYYDEMGGEWEAVQIVYPDGEGRWPWDENADERMLPVFNLIAETDGFHKKQ